MRVGSYELSEVVGRGGMAQVWRARRLEVGDEVAMKVITAPGTRTTRYRRYFDNEIAAVARLAHPSIVQILDVGVLSPDESIELALDAGSPFLVMEFVDGPTLAASSLNLDWLDIRGILDGVLRALAHAHARGVLHLDIKPANVLLKPVGPGWSAILTDFGIARARDAITAPDSTRTVGTPMHMAPEQVLGAWRDYCPATDLYAIGTVAWKLATGSPPYHGESTFDLLRRKTLDDPGDFRPQIACPRGLEEWIRKLLSRDHRDRFQSAAGARAELSRVEDPSRSFRMPSDWRGGDVDLPYDPSGALVGLRVPPFVGRTKERDHLWGALRNVAARGAHFTVIAGDAGIGKTRLAEWLGQRAAELGVATSVAATHGAVRTPLDGFSGMLARHFRTTSLDHAGTVARIIDELSYPADSADETVSIDAVSLGDIAMPPGANEPGRLMNTAETSRVVSRYLRRLADSRPLILVLDDIQWGLDSLALVRTLLDVHPEAPILVVATYRTDDQPEFDRVFGALADHPRTSRLMLDPLDDESAAALIRQVLTPTPELTRRLVADADGVPALLIETIADLMDRGELIRTSGGWALRDDTQPTRNSLAHLWQRRVQFVIGSDQRSWIALEVAAALGLKFDGHQWREGCKRLDVPLTAELAERLVRFRIVRLDVPEDREVDAYSFAHEALRQTILENASSANRRARIEATVAEIVDELFGASVNPAVLHRVARHWEAAGRLDCALPLLSRAAIRSHHLGELADAEAALERHAALSAALDDPPPSEELRRTLYRLWISERRGESIELDAVDSVLDDATTLDDTELFADAARLKSKLMRTAGRPGFNDDLYLAAERLDPDEAPLTLARVLATLGWGEGLSGKSDDALTKTRRAIELFEAHDDHHWSSTSLRAEAYLLAQRERYPEAQRSLERAMDWARRGGDHAELAGAYQHLGELHRYQENYGEAEENYRRAEDLYDSISSPSIAGTKLNRALAAIGRSDDAEASVLVEAVCRLVDENPALGQLRPFAHLARALLAARLGDWTRWLDARDIAYELERSEWRERDFAWLFELFGDLAGSSGHIDRAQRCYQVSARMWDGVGRWDDARRIRDKMGEDE